MSNVEKIKEKTEDLIKRKDIAKAYIEYIRTFNDENKVIALDAPWGSGKTVMIEYMMEYITQSDNQKELFMTYNAWDNDHTNEPLMSLMNTFFKQHMKEENDKNSKLSKLKDITYNAVKGAAVSGVKKIGNLVVGENSTKEIEELIKEVTSGVTSSLVDDAFNALDQSKESRDNFTETFKETICQLLEKEKKERFIIIIDELDRCKPTFAIELLENIKHLFEIKKVVFIIAVDLEQMSESIKVIYGQGFDSTTYLHRFFNVELHLPMKNAVKFYTKKLESIVSLEYEKDTKLIEYAIENFDLTLRDFERIITEAYLILKMNELDKLKHDIIMIYIVFLILKYKCIDAYNLFEENKEHHFQAIFKKVQSIDGYNNNILSVFIVSHAKFIFTPSSGSPLNEDAKKCFTLIRETLQ